MEPVKRQCTEASQDSQQSGYSYDSDDDLVEDSGFAVEAEDSDDGHAGGADSDDEVMDAAALAREQDEAIGRIAGLFDQPRTTAAALLRHFKWREEALMERYFEDSAKVLADAGIAAAPAGGAASSAALVCGVCFCESAPAETSAAPCGHAFCNDCWSGHIKAQIGDGASAVPCMAEKCAVALEAAMVQGLTSADDWAKFSRFSQASFVNDNPFLKWCPAAGCGKAVKASRTGAHEVSCSCGMIFCFGCSVEAHYPLSCAQLQAWDEKNKSDSETAKYSETRAAARTGSLLCPLALTRAPAHARSQGQHQEVPQVPDADREERRLQLYAARRSGLRALRAQASRAPCAQANEPHLRPRQG